MGEKPTNLKSGISSGTFRIREFFKNLLGVTVGHPGPGCQVRSRALIFAFHFQWRKSIVDNGFWLTSRARDPDLQVGYRDIGCRHF